MPRKCRDQPRLRLCENETSVGFPGHGSVLESLGRRCRRGNCQVESSRGKSRARSSASISQYLLPLRLSWGSVLGVRAAHCDAWCWPQSNVACNYMHLPHGVHAAFQKYSRHWQLNWQADRQLPGCQQLSSHTAGETRHCNLRRMNKAG